MNVVKQLIYFYILSFCSKQDYKNWMLFQMITKLRPINDVDYAIT